MPALRSDGPPISAPPSSPGGTAGGVGSTRRQRDPQVASHGRSAFGARPGTRPPARPTTSARVDLPVDRMWRSSSTAAWDPMDVATHEPPAHPTTWLRDRWPGTHRRTPSPRRSGTATDATAAAPWDNSVPCATHRARPVDASSSAGSDPRTSRSPSPDMTSAPCGRLLASPFTSQSHGHPRVNMHSNSAPIGHLTASAKSPSRRRDGDGRQIGHHSVTCAAWHPTTSSIRCLGPGTAVGGTGWPSIAPGAI